MSDKHDLNYYLKCVQGGALACGLTHTAIVTLDLVKCKRQVDPNMYKSLGDGIKTLYSTKGVRGITTGWAPTLVGYSFQGMGKFGFYELFKDVYAKIAGENVHKYKVLGFATASASAEVLADLLLCPWEALKVRMQTAKPGTFPETFGAAFNKLKADEGMQGFYKGIGPLWARQIPYTIVKFVFFEKTVEWFYANILTAKPKNEYSKSTQLSITFASGYIAGVLCAIVSHPADTMVSKLNNVKTEGSSGAAIKNIYKDIGFSGLWRGLSTRIIMIGTLTGLQWWIYDSFKTAVGLQTSGGFAKKEELTAGKK